MFSVILAVVFSTFLFSCETDSITESETLFETQATEGDDGDPVTPPPPPGG